MKQEQQVNNRHITCMIHASNKSYLMHVWPHVHIICKEQVFILSLTTLKMFNQQLGLKFRIHLFLQFLQSKGCTIAQIMANRVYTFLRKQCTLNCCVCIFVGYCRNNTCNMHASCTENDPNPCMFTKVCMFSHSRREWCTTLQHHYL